MKMKILTTFAFALFGVAITVQSCREESLQNSQEEQSITINDGTLKSGRLYFPNKESLTFAYDKIKNAED